MRKFTRLAVSGVAGLAIAGAPVALVTTGVAGAATTTASVSAHTARIATQWPLVRVGNRGPRVVVAQFMLQARRYSVPVTGYFGAVTRTNVTRFQRSVRVRADGVIGPATWTRLVVGPLRLGSRGGPVRALQNSLRYGYGFRIGINGVFNGPTRSAVMTFQRRFRIRADGVVGQVTWRLLIANER
jgi:zinc D-Ala-D-Ala carboxypeptidase